MRHLKCFEWAGVAAAMLLHGCGSFEGTQSGSATRLDSIVVAVTGNDYRWHFQYPGPDGKLGTSDDRFSSENLYLPDNAKVRLQLQSKDYVYTFALPKLGLKEIAVPDLDFALQFQTGPEETFEYLGDQYCGYSHRSLIGKVFVLPQNEAGFYARKIG
jgi:cytochrome c oxidase subunit 2